MPVQEFKFRRNNNKGGFQKDSAIVDLKFVVAYAVPLNTINTRRPRWKYDGRPQDSSARDGPGPEAFGRTNSDRSRYFAERFSGRVLASLQIATTCEDRCADRVHVIPGPLQARRRTTAPEAREGFGGVPMRMFVTSYGNRLPHSRQAT
jgi:hypothetical protein